MHQGAAVGPSSRLVRGLLLACHPGPAAAVTVLAALLGRAAGASPGTVALAVGLGQLSVGWSNDWVDAARDAAVGRTAKPIAGGLVPRRLVGAAAVVAAVLTVPASLLLGPAAGAVHLVAVGSAWSYNLGLKRTFWSFLPYAVSFGLLPAVVTLSLPSRAWPPWWLALAGAFLGVGAHLANALPDLDDDERTGVRGLPHRLGRRTSGVLAPLLLLVASGVLVLAPAGPPPVLGWAALAAVALLGAVAAVVALRRPASRVPFVATIVAALVDVVLLVLTGPFR